MRKLSSDFELEKFGLHVRFVTECDAEFIVNLRNLPKAQFLNQTDTDVNKQIEWTREYKKRENEGLDYYFIFSKNGKRLGTSRIYGINPIEKELTTGSWIFISEADSMDAILANIITKDLSIELFPGYRYLFDVRKGNKRVLQYHKLFKPQLLSETDLDYFFELNVEEYQKKKDKILKSIL